MQKGVIDYKEATSISTLLMKSTMAHGSVSYFHSSGLGTLANQSRQLSLVHCIVVSFNVIYKPCAADDTSPLQSSSIDLDGLSANADEFFTSKEKRQEMKE